MDAPNINKRSFIDEGPLKITLCKNYYFTILKVFEESPTVTFTM